jgi:hypothetical protein
MTKWVRPYRDDVIRLYVRILTIALFFFVISADEVASALLDLAGNEHDDVRKWLTGSLRVAGLLTFMVLTGRDQSVKPDESERQDGLLQKFAFWGIVVALVAWISLVMDVFDVSTVEQILLTGIPIATALGWINVVARQRQKRSAKNQ